ncbi:hypothetical protein B0T25DRAFT_257979 [Lasiosphaeria hispida]|uniref:Uncharacterized protein n=1 Tax=Lasiosphaeria hispida TaxID=260671 RepID=A0AAJ0HFU9_9PEZI|nr:hypothetical protein B0T25DRAFT_257979 [Lasiosphaeria hispida]
MVGITVQPHRLNLRACAYIPQANLAKCRGRFRKEISKSLSRRVKQEVQVEEVASPSLQDVVAGKEGLHDGMVFCPLEVTFELPQKQPTLPLSRQLPIDDGDRFDIVFKELCSTIKGRKMQSIGGSKGSTLVCWSLWDPQDPSPSKMARWVLPAPDMSLEVEQLPAQRMETVLYKLVNIATKRQDNAHRACGGKAVFDCVECQLYEQSQAHFRLMELLDKRSGEKETTHDFIQTQIQALQAVDKALAALVDLFDEHVGRSLPARDRNRFIRLVKNLFRSRLAAVAIDSEEVERLKKNARRELASLQRIAPILAAHIRLRDPSAVAELKRACDAAAEGPEKREMPEKLALAPAKIGNAAAHAAAFQKVRRCFDEAHARVLAELEVLNKVVGREYARRGDALFRRGRKAAKMGGGGSRWRRGGGPGPSPPSGVCRVEEAASEKRPWRCDGSGGSSSPFVV